MNLVSRFLVCTLKLFNSNAILLKQSWWLRLNYLCWMPLSVFCLVIYILITRLYVIEKSTWPVKPWPLVGVSTSYNLRWVTRQAYSSLLVDLVAEGSQSPHPQDHPPHNGWLFPIISSCLYIEHVCKIAKLVVN